MSGSSSRSSNPKNHRTNQIPGTSGYTPWQKTLDATKMTTVIYENILYSFKKKDWVKYLHQNLRAYFLILVLVIQDEGGGGGGGENGGP
jgi:hypothetical protein